MPIRLFEADVYDTVAEEVVTLRFADAFFVTARSDAEPDLQYENRLLDSGGYRRSIFTESTVSGDIDINVGAVLIDTTDGAKDDLLNYEWSGRPIRLKTVQAGQPLSTASLTLTGVAEFLEVQDNSIRVNFLDPLAQLDAPIPRALYAGTTDSLSSMVAEGTVDDLKDQRKPRLYGGAVEVPALLVHPFKRVYQVSDRAIIVDGVYDGGLALNFSQDYATLAELLSASISPSQYHTCEALGYVRIGTQAVYTLTVKASDDSIGSATAGQIVKQILLDAGVDGASIDDASLAALDTFNSSPCEYWTGTDSVSALSAIGEVLASIGGYVTLDSAGCYCFGQFEGVSGSAITTVTPSEYFGDIERLDADVDTRGQPIWRVTVKYGKNYRVLDGVSVAGAVPEERRAVLSQEYRSAVSENNAIKSISLLAGELELSTHLIDRADAEAEAARLLALYSVSRVRYRVSVPAVVYGGLNLGDVVTLQSPRFGLSSGKDGVVVAIEDFYSDVYRVVDIWC